MPACRSVTGVRADRELAAHRVVDEIAAGVRNGPHLRVEPAEPGVGIDQLHREFVGDLRPAAASSATVVMPCPAH
jgi:hypothetical protein